MPDYNFFIKIFLRVTFGGKRTQEELTWPTGQSLVSSSGLSLKAAHSQVSGVEVWDGMGSDETDRQTDSFLWHDVLPRHADIMPWFLLLEADFPVYKFVSCFLWRGQCRQMSTGYAQYIKEKPCRAH